MVSLLLQYGAKLELTNSFNRTPLLLASKNNHFSIVQYLFLKGAKLDCYDWNIILI